MNREDCLKYLFKNMPRQSYRVPDFFGIHLYIYDRLARNRAWSIVVWPRPASVMLRDFIEEGEEPDNPNDLQ